MGITKKCVSLHVVFSKYQPMKRYLFPFLLLLLALTAAAQNPVIHDQFTADPTARVFGDRVYLYPSHDIFPPEGARQDWFCMADYHVFSSDNLTDWKSSVGHGWFLYHGPP